MCGYCLELTAINAWRTGNFEADYFASEVNLDNEFKPLQAHVLPECIDSMQLNKDSGTSYGYASLWIWYRLRTGLCGSSEASFDSEIWPLVWQAFQAHEQVATRDLLDDRFPLLTTLISSASFTDMKSTFSHPLPALLEEAESFCCWISNDFRPPELVDNNHEEGGLFSQMLIYEEVDEHPVFTRSPVLLCAAVELLLQFRPNTRVLAEIVTYQYPCPDENSYMMAWQRYFLWQLFTINGVDWLCSVLDKISLSHVAYLAMRCQQDAETMSVIRDALEYREDDDEFVSLESAREWVSEKN